MEIELVDNLDSAWAFADSWRELAAANPLLSPDWLLPWWQHFGRAPESHLALLVCRSSPKQFVGIAPLFAREHMGSYKWMSLGSGIACTDYMRILSKSADSAVVAQSIVNHLFEQSLSRSYFQRSSISIEAIEESSICLSHLQAALNERGFRTWLRPIANSYRVDLQDSFDLFLATRSASARRKARRVIARLESGEVQFKRTVEPQELQERLGELERLHRARRAAMGQTGCYADERFGSFLRDAIPRLSRHGYVAIEWCERDGQTIASHLVLQGTDTIYMYHSGIAPDAMEVEPGHILTISAIARAIQDGYRQYDFLRGDEAYKAFWGGQSVPLVSLHGTPPKVLSRLAGYTHESLWHAKRSTKNVLRFVKSLQQTLGAKQ